jgi:hypothetical protein
MQPTHSIEIVEVKRTDRLLALYCSFVYYTRKLLSVQHEKYDEERHGRETIGQGEDMEGHSASGQRLEPPCLSQPPFRRPSPQGTPAGPPSPTWSACPGRVGPPSAWLRGARAGLRRRAGCAARAVGTAWPPAGDPGEGAVGAGTKGRLFFLSARMSIVTIGVLWRTSRISSG